MRTSAMFLGRSPSLEGYRSARYLAPVRPVVVPLLVCLLLSASPARAWHRLAPGPEGWSETFEEGIRGVTIGPIESSQQRGRGYGTPYTEALLDHLASMGVNWISITPFGRIWSLSSTSIRMDFEAPYEESRAGVRRIIEQAHARGIRVLVIPHLWVETGGWRGEIDPGSPERWAAFQASYRAFVLAWARDAAAAGADALSLGVECKSWSGRFGGFWRSFIADVRGVFPGLLTYSSNWDEAENVVFWDQLDLVGINAFYPLAAADGASDDDYVAGAERVATSVADLAERFQMPILFVEVGYTTRSNAAIEPWLWPDDMTNVTIDEHEQARALDASLRAFLPHRWFTGFFVWRYYANLDDVSQERFWGFSPHAKQTEPMLALTFRSGWGVDLPRTAGSYLAPPAKNAVFAPFALP